MGSTNAIDIEQLKERYREERDKRLRADGNSQYIRIEGQLSHYLEDPYTPITPREPKTDHVTFTFIGGGFAGLVTGARLKEYGVDNVRIVEKGGDFGGTWYWNRYPGAQCDTASFVYMPLLEETGHMPTEKYAHAPEIRAHCSNIGKQFGLYDNALFHTQVNRLTWLPEKMLAGRNSPGRLLHHTIHRHGYRPIACAQATWHSGYRNVQGPLFSHQSLGLRLHRRNS